MGRGAVAVMVGRRATAVRAFQKFCATGAIIFAGSTFVLAAACADPPQPATPTKIDPRQVPVKIAARFGSVDRPTEREEKAAPNPVDVHDGTATAVTATDTAGSLGALPQQPVKVAVSSASTPGGAVVIGVRRLPTQLDPTAELDPWGFRIVEDLVFEGLVARAPARAPWVEARLADRWEFDSADAPQVVDFRLRDGVVFHDGTPVTPADVVYSFQRWLDPRREAWAERVGLDVLASAEILDAGRQGEPGDAQRWVRIKLRRREPLALEVLSLVKVVPKPRGRATTPLLIGTGPMQARIEADRIVCERATQGPRSDRRPIHLSQVVLRQVVDGAQGLTWLRRGELDILAEVASVHVPVELAKPGMAARFSAWVLSPPRYDLLVYNLRGGESAQPGVRAALDEAVPLHKIAQTVYRSPGLGVAAPIDMHEPTQLDLFALDPGAGQLTLPGLPMPGDLALDAQAAGRAEQALTDLGWLDTRGIRLRDGNRLHVALMWDGSRGLGVGVSTAIRAAWRRLGIADYHASVGFAHYLRLLHEGKFDVALLRLAGHDDADLYRYFHSRGSFNFSGVADSQLDDELEAFRRARSREDRMAIEARIAQRLSDLRVVTVIYASTHLMLARRELVGWTFEDDLPRLDLLSWPGGSKTEIAVPPIQPGQGEAPSGEDSPATARVNG